MSVSYSVGLSFYFPTENLNKKMNSIPALKTNSTFCLSHLIDTNYFNAYLE